MLCDAVRFDADHSRSLGLYILTGSCVPTDMSEVIHSGTGRFGWLKMRPISLWESGESSGDVSIKALFENTSIISGISSIDLPKIAFLCCRGGWPLSLDMDEDISKL